MFLKFFMSATHSSRPTIFFARNKIFFARNKIFFAHNKIFFAHNKIFFAHNMILFAHSKIFRQWTPVIDAGSIDASYIDYFNYSVL